MEPKNPEVGDIEIRFGTALICITSLRGWTMFFIPAYSSKTWGNVRCLKSWVWLQECDKKNMKEDPSGDPSDGSKF